MNAQAEFLSHIMNLPNIKAVTILHDKTGYGNDPDQITIYNLYEGFTDEDFTKFIENLDFDYDHSYGTQHLFGKIWYEDDSWSDRYEYDGSECWDYKSCTKVWHFSVDDKLHP